MTSARGLRLARSAMFATLCVVVSALGHAMMSGAPVPVWSSGYAFACVTAGAWWLTGRERGGLAVTGATVVTQAVLHCVFTLGQTLPSLPPGGPGTGGAAMPMAGMSGTVRGTGAINGMGAMSGMAHLAATSGTGPYGPPGGMDMHEWSPGMLAAHLAAALLCGLWLWRGEVAVYRLGRALASFLMTPLRRARAVRTIARPPALRTPRATRRRARRPAEVSLRHVLVRRGPPRPCLLHRSAPVRVL